MNKNLLNLQMMLVSVLDEQKIDISPDEIQSAWKEAKVIPLLKEKLSANALFRGMSQTVKLDDLEEPLNDLLAGFIPRSSKYDLRQSGLCLLIGAITYQTLNAT